MVTHETVARASTNDAGCIGPHGTSSSHMGRLSASFPDHERSPVRGREDDPFSPSHEQPSVRKRPPRAAAAAATRDMARQVKEEASPLSMLISSTLVSEEQREGLETKLGDGNAKKRTARGAREGVKRVRMAAVHVTQERPRERKRRPASVEDVRMMEASPIITDLPPLPFTIPSFEAPKPKHKPTSKPKTRMTSAVKDMDSEDDRTCEFCRKVANICSLLHCHACRRVYHAQCFVRAFKPYVNASVPIAAQIDHLLLETAERRGNIFRCVSCKAAFLDFYESGGYMWDCKCPTCLKPETIRVYRRNKLLQMMKDMDLAKQRKKEEKHQKKTGNVCTTDNLQVLPSTPRNVSSRSRRAQEGKTCQKTKVISVEDVSSCATTQDVNEEMKAVKLEEVSELSGDDLVRAVLVVRDDTAGSWCFPVMCSRISSLRDAGVMKTGKCTWLPPTQLRIQCSCCTKVMNPIEFVHHTDTCLIPSPSAARNESMQFLFVEHRDATQYTLLETFLQALRSSSCCPCTSKSVENPRQASTEDVAVAELSAMSMANSIDDVPTPVARLQALAIFKHPQHPSSKFEFVAQIVCLPSKYVMNMQNGTLADRVVRSKTPVPGDSFPRKTGWLPFNRTPTPASQIRCACCDAGFTFDEFARHAGISMCDLNVETAHQLLYVVERLDASALVPFDTFLCDLEFITSKKMDAFLNELEVPPLPLYPR